MNVNRISIIEHAQCQMPRIFMSFCGTISVHCMRIDRTNTVLALIIFSISHQGTRAKEMKKLL